MLHPYCAAMLKRTVIEFDSLTTYIYYVTHMKDFHSSYSRQNGRPKSKNPILKKKKHRFQVQNILSPAQVILSAFHGGIQIGEDLEHPRKEGDATCGKPIHGIRFQRVGKEPAGLLRDRIGQ